MSRTKFTSDYETSPIIFTGGIAQNISGGLLAISSITQAKDYPQGVTGSANPSPSQDDDPPIFTFYPLPGASLAEYQIGQYPFANQAVAANAIISDPLHVSLMMLAPVNTAGGYDAKLSAFQALKSAISQHANKGGTYTVATPSYIYTNCILLGLKDVSPGDPKRVQDHWQWDFVQPLLSLEAAQQAQNSLMSQMSGGTKVTPGADGKISYSGPGPAVGNPASGVGASVVGAAKTVSGATVSGPQPITRGPV